MKTENMSLSEIREYNRELRHSMLTVFLMTMGTFWLAWAIERATRDEFGWQNPIAWIVMWVSIIVSIAVPVVYLVRKISLKRR